MAEMEESPYLSLDVIEDIKDLRLECGEEGICNPEDDKCEEYGRRIGEDVVSPEEGNVT